MKKLFLVISLMVLFGISFAHPGDDLEDAKGCHHCWTNCSHWGYDYGEFHCHEKDPCPFSISETDKSISDASKRSNKEVTIALYNNILNGLIYMKNYWSGYIKTQETLIRMLSSCNGYSNACMTNLENAVKIGEKVTSCKNTIKQIDNYIINLNYIISNNNVNLDTNTSSNELSESISWMYNNGLTMYNNKLEFRDQDYLTREQASRFFVQFTKKTLNKSTDISKSINLNDLEIADPTLQSYIKESNQLGLFKGINGKFLPFNKLTQAQAIAVIIRSKDGIQNENGEKRYNEYYNIADSYGLLEGLGFDYYNLDTNYIKRGEVGILLYRLNNFINS